MYFQSRLLALAELEFYDPRSPDRRTQRRFLCPFCGDAKPRDAAHRSLCLNATTGAWICHRCGEKGRLGEYKADRPGGGLLVVGNHRVTPARSFDWRRAWHWSSRLCGSPGADYIERRSVPASLAEASGVRFYSAWYRRPALLFPIHDEAGTLVAVSGRFVDRRKHPKTQTAGKKSLGVYSTPGALTSGVVAVVEGGIDALSLALCGVPAVAMIGTSWASWLPQSLAPRAVLIATDADAAGDESAGQLAAALAAFECPARRLRPAGGKDWNDELLRLGCRRMQSHLRGCVAEANILSR